MTKREQIQNDLQALNDEGKKLASKVNIMTEKKFRIDYQGWYTKALKAVASLAPDRFEEFRAYYESDPKRKSLDWNNYVIQDYIKCIEQDSFYKHFNPNEKVLICFSNQLSILNAIGVRIDSVLANIEGELYTEIQDGEIAVARQLSKFSFRATGAIVGVLIEGHLQKVAQGHSIKIGKKNSTIADLNDQLKAESVIDQPTWRKISYLADIRNLCLHKKNVEPTREQVNELIQGAEWLTKSVF